MRITFSVVFLLTTLLSFGQSTPQWHELLDDPNANFYTIQKAFEAEWEGKAYERGRGYKQYKRWEYFVENRVYPSGDLNLLSQTYSERMKGAKGGSISSKSNHVWQEVGPINIPGSGGGAGRLTFVRFHPTQPNIIYVGTPNGGLWKSTDNGDTWSNSNDYLSVIGCSDLLFHPTSPDTMYLATGDNDHTSTQSIGVMKSTDGGLTWNMTGLTFTPVSVRVFKMGMHPADPNILMAATTSGLRRSINGGDTWTQVSSGNYRDLEFSPSDPNIVYASTTTQFKRSTDGGATWQTIVSGLSSGTGNTRLAIAVSPDEPNAVWVAIAKSDNGLRGIYKSTDNGLNFTLITGSNPNMLDWSTDGSGTGGQGWYDLALAVNPLDADEIWLGGINVWNTTNGGSSWQLKGHWFGGGGAPYVHADIHDIVFQPGTNNLMIGHDGGISISSNGGASYLDKSDGLAISQMYLIGQSSQQENRIISGHQDNGTNLMNGLGTWNRVVGGDGMSCFIDWNNPNRMMGSIQYGDHRRSTNGGANFTVAFSGLPQGAWVSRLIQDPVNPEKVFACGRNQLAISTNFGASYTNVNTGLSTQLINVVVSRTSPNIVYVLQGTGGAARILRSEDGGNTFTNVTGNLPTNVALVNLAVDPLDPMQVFAVYSGFSPTSKVYKSSTGGNVWTNISSGLPNVPCNVLLVQRGTNQDLYLGNDMGVYFKDSLSASWTVYGDSLPHTEITDLDFHYPSNQLVAGTYGRGIWRISALNTTSDGPQANFYGSSTTLCESNQVAFTNSSANNPTSYNWTFQGGNPSTSTASDPVVTYSTSGQYDVRLIASNSSGSDTLVRTQYINVQNCLGIEEGQDFAWKIYPQPAQQTITIEGLSQVEQLEICTMDGKCFALRFQVAGTDKVEADVQFLSAGMYTLRVKSASGHFHRQVVLGR